jgi:hypothetical protein
MREWERSLRTYKIKAYAQGKAHANPDKLIILYECPHNDRKKHNHHPDYNLWDEVEKLCHQCHMAKEAQIRRFRCNG